jgi:hypothetical protein
VARQICRCKGRGGGQVERGVSRVERDAAVQLPKKNIEY